MITVIKSHNTPRKPKELWFDIVFKVKGEKVFQTVSADRWSEAKAYCEKQGEFVKCEYITTATDLEYIH